MKNEYVLNAAIWFKDDKKYVHQPKNIENGYVVCGRRHHNCFQINSMITKMNLDGVVPNEQGFITSHDRFVDRKEAMVIAKQANQIINLDNIRGDNLYSEDLY